MFAAVANRRRSRVVAAVERVLGLLVAAAAVVPVLGDGAGRRIRPRGPPALSVSGLRRCSKGSGIMSRDTVDRYSGQAMDVTPVVR